MEDLEFGESTVGRRPSQYSRQSCRCILGLLLMVAVLVCLILMVFGALEIDRRHGNFSKEYGIMKRIDPRDVRDVQYLRRSAGSLVNLLQQQISHPTAIGGVTDPIFLAIVATACLVRALWDSIFRRGGSAKTKLFAAARRVAKWCNRVVHDPLFTWWGENLGAHKVRLQRLEAKCRDLEHEN